MQLDVDMDAVALELGRRDLRILALEKALYDAKRASSEADAAGTGHATCSQPTSRAS